MRLIKILGLAAVAAAAVMAFAASSAMAEEHSVTLCLADVLLCKAENAIVPPAGGSVLVLAETLKTEPPVLLTSGFFGNEECAESHVSVEAKDGETGNKEGMGTPNLHGKITSLTFTGKCESCTKVESNNLPWPVELSMEKLLEGDFKFSSSYEKAEATLSGCAFGVECKYGTGGAKIELLSTKLEKEGQEKALLHITAEKIKLPKTGGGGLCPGEGLWDALYVVTTAHLFNSTGGEVGLHNLVHFSLAALSSDC